MRAAFRRLARETHPDRGGSADAFHEIRAAYGALMADLDGERQRWRTPPMRAVRFTAGLDPQTFPTCTVQIRQRRGGAPTVEYLTERRPASWRPGVGPPPGGACVARVAATGGMPAFGVWRVPLDAHRFRCVFGPAGD